jgi:hypothetical protein
MMRLLRHALPCLAVALIGGYIAPARAQCTLPYTLSNGQPPDATKVMANFNALASCLSVGGATNSVQYNAGSGSLGGIGPLTNGQVLIGSTGNAPQAQTLSAGAGITITNGAGTIAVSASGQASTGLYREVSSGTPTSASTGLSNWLNQANAVLNEGPIGMSIAATLSSNVMARFTPAPLMPYKLRALIAATRNGTTGTQTASVGIGFYDGFSKLHLLSYAIGFQSGGTPRLEVQKWSSPTVSVGNDVSVNNIYYPQPIWLQLQDDGTSVSFAFSHDGANFLTVFSVAKSSGYLGSAGYNNLLFFVAPGGSFSNIGTLMSWTVN